MLSIAFMFLITLPLLHAETQPVVNTGSILYPHGLEDHDRLKLDETSDLTSDASTKIHLNFNLTFFGHRFNHIHVANNGYFYFHDYVNNDFTYGDFPVPAYPYNADLPMILVYYARVDINDNDDRQMVYFRQMKRDLSIDDADRIMDQNEKQIQRRNNIMLADLERVIHRAIVGADLFFAEYAICATWRNLTFSGAKRPVSGRDKDNLKNTFQAVIVTNQNETYAVFNYDVIEWAADELHPTNEIYARIGFNRGNGTDWYGLDRFSGKKVATDIDDNSNSDAWGRYVFRIDAIYDGIMVGGCNNDTSGKLQSFPNHGGMLGGEQVNVSGPCFKPDDRIMCKFHDEIVEGKYIALQRARCIAPGLKRIGIVSLSISINGSPFPDWTTNYTIVTPDRVAHSVRLVDPHGWSEMPPPDTLGIKWDRLYFAQETYSTIDVVLFGYREDPENEDPEQRLQGKTLAVLSTYEDNDGFFEFRTFDVRKRSGAHYDEIEKFEMGAIGVSISKNRNISLWSPLMALGWWNHWDLKLKYGELWAMERCRQWYVEDIKDQSKTDWRKDIQPCPCKLSQALKDIGRFIADPDCDFRRHPKTCIYNKGAHHCVRSVFSTPKGASAHCCYNPKGDLMYTQDTHEAGGANRAHLWGQCPYAVPFKVPALSRFYHDVLPYHYCCIWTKFSMESWYDYKFYYPCKWYLEQRNTTGCDRYEPPGPAYIFGDPHFRTFNDSAYTFNGKGEYKLLESLDFKMHGFFEQVENNSYGQVNATRLTAVAMQEGSGSLVELRVNLPTCRWRNQLQVIVNGRDIQFNSTMNKWQWFRGESSYFSGDVSVFNREEDVGTHNVTVMFPSGTGIQAVEANGVLNVYVSASPRFYRNTSGLLGFWDRWKDNDLMLPDKKVFITTVEHEYLYKSYGIKWQFDSKQSQVLMHPIGRNFSYTYLTYNLRQFYPIFGTTLIPKNANFTEEGVRQFCKEDGLSQEVNEECVYDYRTTANPEIARNTKEQAVYWRHLYEGIKPHNSCGVLPIRGDWEGAERFPQTYMADTIVKVGCKKGFNFWGQSRWTCNREGHWEGDRWGRDEEWPMCLTIRHTAEYSGIVGAPVVGGFLFILVVLVFLVQKKRAAPPRINPFSMKSPEGDADAEGECHGGDVELKLKEDWRAEEDEKEKESSSSSGSLRVPSISEGVANEALETTPSVPRKKTSNYIETEGL